VALRKKHLGRWRTYTWREVGDRMAAVAGGLHELGVRPADRVGIISDNRPAWLLADLGAQALGAVTVALDPVIDAAGVARRLKAAKATVVIVEDEEQADKVLPALGQGGLAHLVVVDPRGVDLEQPGVVSLAALEERGRAAALDLAEVVGDVGLDDAATVLDGEGLGAAPAAIVTHGELAAAAAAAVAELGIDGRTEVLSHVPLGRAAERVVSEASLVLAGCVVSFPEAPSTFPQDLREVQPTLLLGGPHLWAGLRGEVEARMADAGWVKRSAFRWSLGRGGLATLLVHRPLARKLGLSRLRTGVAADEAVEADVLDWYRSIGVRLRVEPFAPGAPT
jgi:long-chain acyl-CoA synthetase